MGKFSEKFSDVLSMIAEVVDDNKYLSVIKNTFSIYMPFIIAGSFATLLRVLISSNTSGLAKWIPQLEKLTPAFNAVNFATMSIMTIGIIFIMGVLLGKRNNVPQYLSGLVALASYISVVPNSITQVIDDANSITTAALPATAINAQGLFVGMILTILVVEFFSKLCSLKKLKISMPPSVPSQISTSFNVLIPIFITLILFGSLGCIFKEISGVYINDWIYQVVQTPLEHVFQSPVGIIGITIFMQLFWLLGIHGGLVISPIRNPLMISALAANIASVEAGKSATQPITTGFWNVFITVGGAGITLSLIFALFVFSKRDDHKMMAKLAFAPGLCGISEPLVFGLPLVMNPIFAIPFVLSSGIATAISIFAVNLGFISPSIVDVPFGIPIILNAFIGFGWQGIIIQVLILVVCFALYAPFVLMANKQIESTED